MNFWTFLAILGNGGYSTPWSPVRLMIELNLCCDKMAGVIGPFFIPKFQGSKMEYGPQTNIAAENRPSQKENWYSEIPTIHFFRCKKHVSFRQGNDMRPFFAGFSSQIWTHMTFKSYQHLPSTKHHLLIRIRSTQDLKARFKKKQLEKMSEITYLNSRKVIVVFLVYMIYNIAYIYMYIVYQ